MAKINSPVFIIGTARSGTTWLSNILKENFGLFTPAHFLHHGVKEPNLFGLDRLLTKLNDREKFLQRIRHSDNMMLMNLSNISLEGLQFDSYHDLYCQVMDGQVPENSSQGWFTKLDPDYFYNKSEFQTLYKYLMERYDNPRFIVIKRNFHDYLQSYLYMPRKNYNTRSKGVAKVLSCLLASARYGNLYSLEGNYKKSSLYISYEGLLTDYSGQLDRLQDFLQIPLISKKRRREKNSSRLTTRAGLSVTVERLLSGMMNFTRINALFLSGYNLLKSRGDISLYNRVHLLNEDPERLREQLNAINDTVLIDKLQQYLDE